MMRFGLALAACWWIFAEVSLAQDENEQDPLQGWNDFYAERMTQYEISLTGGVNDRFQLHPDPLLRYTNPVRGRDQHGAVFAWTRAGRTSPPDRTLAPRPEVLGTVWSISVANNPGVRRTSHEMHSLAAVPLSVECPALDDPDATRARALSWTLEQDAESLSLPSGSTRPPTESRPRRLIQMRQIASQLSAVSIDRNDGAQRPLRLMPTPLMRYQDASVGVIDGSVFAFVLATDPELLVLIEAVDEAAAGGEGSWRVRPARFTGTELRLSHRKKEIWRCQPINYQNQTGPYRLSVGVSELPR